jgi:hypothetical protein
LAGFSTQAPGKMASEFVYKMYSAYWTQGTYADKFVSGALLNNEAFAGLTAAYRLEAAKYGAVALNLWMYIIHEALDAVEQCEEGATEDDEEHVFSFDESAAFYLGSLIGENGKGQGYSMYSLPTRHVPE